MSKKEMTIASIKYLVGRKGTVFYLIDEDGHNQERFAKVDVRAFCKRFKDQFTWIDAEQVGNIIYIFRQKD